MRPVSTHGETTVSTVDMYEVMEKGVVMFPRIRALLDYRYETMVFGGPMDGECFRYDDEDQAIAGHEEVYEKVKGFTNE